MDFHHLFFAFILLGRREAAIDQAAMVTDHEDMADISGSEPSADAGQRWSQWSQWGACSETNGKEGTRMRSRSCNLGTGCVGSGKEEEKCQLFVSATADMVWRRPDGREVVQGRGVKGVRFPNGDFVFLLKTHNPGNWHEVFDGMIWEFVHTTNDGTVRKWEYTQFEPSYKYYNPNWPLSLVRGLILDQSEKQLGRVYVDRFKGVKSNLYWERRFYRCEKELSENECKSLFKVISTNNGVDHNGKILWTENSNASPTGCYYNGHMLIYNTYKGKVGSNGDREKRWKMYSNCEGWPGVDHNTCYCKQVSTTFNYKVQYKGQCQIKLTRDECRTVAFKRRAKGGVQDYDSRGIDWTPPGCSLLMASYTGVYELGWNDERSSTTQCSKRYPCVCSAKQFDVRYTKRSQGKCARKLSKDDCQMVSDKLLEKDWKITDWSNLRMFIDFFDLWEKYGMPKDFVMPSGCVIWNKEPYYSDQDAECSQKAVCYCAA